MILNAQNDMNTRLSSVPLIHCIIHRWHFVPSHARPLLDAASVHRRHQLDECRKRFRACIHANLPKEDILVVNVIQKYTNKYVYWLFKEPILDLDAKMQKHDFVKN